MVVLTPPPSLRALASRALATALGSCVLLSSPDISSLGPQTSGAPSINLLRPPPANAAFTEEQRLVAETWRTVRYVPLRSATLRYAIIRNGGLC